MVEEEGRGRGNEEAMVTAAGFPMRVVQPARPAPAA
jgi:hypothetical protein